MQKKGDWHGDRVKWLDMDANQGGQEDAMTN